MLAAAVRTFVFVAPIGMSIVVTRWGAHWIPRPNGLVGAVLWWGTITVAATAVLWATDRVLRRLLPLVALFRLSLVFPDRAPSRFKVALKSGTVRQLQRDVDAGKLRAVTPQDAAEQLLALAAALSAHDRLTRGHTERVRAYSVMIGEEMGLDDRELELLNWSGLVHDIGKLTVPPEILNKPGRPTDEEWATLREHPARAAELIMPLRSWLGDFADSATQHHERWDGTGYPHGLAGGEITMAGRIVAVADAYDVMTSSRSYKKPMPAEEARRELARCAGTQFDPVAVRAFLNVAIGRLRLVMGPLSSLFQFPAGGASLGSAAVGATAAATVAISSVLGLVEPPEPQVEKPAPVAAPAVADVSDPPDQLDFTPVVVPRVVSDEDTSVDIAVGAAWPTPATSLRVTIPSTNGEVEVLGLDGFRFVPEPDFNGVTWFEYEVCFDNGTCHSMRVDIDVRPGDDPPVATDDTLTLAEDTVASIDVVANDTDPDLDPLTIVDVRVASAAGALRDVRTSVDGDHVVVEPGADQWGTAMVIYTVADPGGLLAEATLAITVEAVNDPPRATDDVATIRENFTSLIDVLANDTDPDGDELRITAVTDVDVGRVEFDERIIRFTPTTDYLGPASFRYTTADPSGATTTGEVSVTVAARAAAPQAVADVATTREDTSVTVAVMTNDVSPWPLDPTTLAVGDGAAHGEAVAADGRITYTPDTHWHGSDAFTYEVCDKLGRCTSAAVAVSVTAVNDAPRFTIGADQTVTEDPGARSVAGWVTGIDPGPNEPDQSVTIAVSTSNPGLFSVAPTIDAAGTLAYTPAADATGTALVSVTITDDGGTHDGGIDRTSQSARITVTTVNDAPVAAADAVDLDEDTVGGIDFDVLANDTDVDGDTLAFVAATGTATLAGTLTDHGDGTFTYVPEEDFHGVEAFSYRVSDPSGAESTATVTITVDPVADPPVASNDARITGVDTPLVVAAPGVLANDYDVDADTIAVVTSPVAGPTNGTVSLAADGGYTYTPAGGFVGTDAFTYRIADPGGLTATATVTVTVDSGTTTTTYFFDDSGPSLTEYDLALAPPPSSNPVADTGGDGNPGRTIDNSGGSESELDPAKYHRWSTTLAAPLALDGPVTVELWATAKDFDTDETAHPYVWLYDCGVLTCTTVAEVDVHLDPWYDGPPGFTRRDIDLGSVSHTFAAGRRLVVRLQFQHEDMWVAMTADYPSALHLTVANQPPVAVDDSLTIVEDDGATNVSVVANDTDADLDPTSVTITVDPTDGTATPLGDGSVDYTPDPDHNGADSFTYEVCDLSGRCDTAVVSVTIDAVNDAPTFTGGGNVTSTGPGPNTFAGWATAIAAGPADEVGQALTFVVTANSAPGLFASGPAVDESSGDLTFTPNGSGSADITVELRDDGGTVDGGDDTSDPVTFTITLP